jgi:hypothetical protein
MPQAPAQGHLHRRRGPEGDIPDSLTVTRRSLGARPR